MLKTLIESNGTRSRRVGGTLASTLVHGLLIAAAVAVTVPGASQATDAPRDPELIYLPQRTPEAARAPLSRSRQVDPAASTPIVTPHVPDFPDPALPSIDVTPSVVSTQVGREEFGPGLPTGGSTGDAGGIGTGTGGIVDEHLVDRAPRLIGRAEPPVFPSALRMSGRNGRAVVQFVVDTLGRAEMGEFRVVDATDPQFADAVRAVLPRYRFSPGEAGSRKVRTLVQLPFDFTLIR